MKRLLIELRTAALVALILAVVCCGAYPLLVFGVAQVAFPKEANGSLIVAPDGTVRGSALIGQPFSGARYFHPRPSAAGANGYDAAGSGGSNLGPTSKRLAAAIASRMAAYGSALPAGASMPADAVTASGSGLDPHISPRNARLQVQRVAAARAIGGDRLLALIDEFTEPPQFGVLGAARVNVLLLNLALDATASSPKQREGRDGPR